MNKKHLIWIIPLIIFISIVFTAWAILGGQGYFTEKYPIIKCIYNMESAINIDNVLTNYLITKESMRRAIEYKCAKEFIPNLDKDLELEEIWEYKE